jgi:hypothetical protein
VSGLGEILLVESYPAQSICVDYSALLLPYLPSIVILQRGNCWSGANLLPKCGSNDIYMKCPQFGFRLCTFFFWPTIPHQCSAFSKHSICLVVVDLKALEENLVLFGRNCSLECFMCLSFSLAALNQRPKGGVVEIIDVC